MRARLSSLCLLGLSLLPQGATAQPAAPAGVDPTAALVPELVVNAPTPGPAWWKVSHGDATVFVLGLPTLAPKQVVFDDLVVRRRLEHADRLILAPAPDVNWLALPGFLLGGRRMMAQTAPMSADLPPDTATRLRALLVRRGQKPDALDHVKPAFAGFMLANSDDGKSLTLSVGDLQDQIEKLARSTAHHPRPTLVRTGRYDILAQVKELARLPAPEQHTCLDDGLRQAESGGGGLKAVAAQWAAGRVRDVTQADRGFEACLARSPRVASDLQRGISASTAAIEAALRSPGLSVALVDLRPLLATDGVLDRLRRQGYEVHAPGQ